MKTVLFCLLMLTAGWLHASKRDAQKKNLDKYLARIQTTQPVASTLSLGSIWVDSGAMASLSADYKARNVGDTIEIVVAQGLTSTNANAVSTARTFSANSGITALPGKLKTAGVANLIGLNSSEALSGKGQASTATTVTTTLAGRVVAVLTSGNLVIEAERIINMNHEKQTILLRGVVRRGDIGPNNTVASDAVGDLELEIKGKGVISDGVRPPHPILRAILNFL
ncbi:MAG: flagellar basal body L-ring protein FlgH, partial [Terriglobales bacterium]